VKEEHSGGAESTATGTLRLASSRANVVWGRLWVMDIVLPRSSAFAGAR